MTVSESGEEISKGQFTLPIFAAILENIINFVLCFYGDITFCPGNLGVWIKTSLPIFENRALARNHP